MKTTSGSTSQGHNTDSHIAVETVTKGGREAAHDQHSVTAAFMKLGKYMSHKTVNIFYLVMIPTPGNV